MPFVYYDGSGNSSTASSILLTSTSTTAFSTLPNHFVTPFFTGCIHYYPTTTSTILTTSNVITTSSTFFNNSNFVYYTDTGQYNSRRHLYETLKAKKGPLIKKSIKSSIKRALKLISNFGMEEDLKIFLGGDSIEISHPESDFKFILSKKKNMLIRATEYCGHHTPYNLHLYTKSNIFVSDLCVYLKDTPILDQLLAVSMFVKSGNENLLLEKANYNKLTNDKELRKTLALENPSLSSKLRADFIDI